MLGIWLLLHPLAACRRPSLPPAGARLHGAVHAAGTATSKVTWKTKDVNLLNRLEKEAVAPPSAGGGGGGAAAARASGNGAARSLSRLGAPPPATRPRMGGWVAETMQRARACSVSAHCDLASSHLGLLQMLRASPGLKHPCCVFAGVKGLGRPVSGHACSRESTSACGRVMKQAGRRPAAADGGAARRLRRAVAHPAGWRDGRGAGPRAGRRRGARLAHARGRRPRRRQGAQTLPLTLFVSACCRVGRAKQEHPCMCQGKRGMIMH